jgi:hypothetical protein
MQDISSDYHKKYFTNDISVFDRTIVTFGVHCVMFAIVFYFSFISKIDIARSLFLILNGTSLEF